MPYIVREWRPEFNEYQYDRGLWKVWMSVEGPKPSWLTFRDTMKNSRDRGLVASLGPAFGRALSTAMRGHQHWPSITPKTGG